ncbi:DDE-type integrase/transposase/recombinase [Streptomyces sp. NPDC020996]|uniref:DDE-type integrase/transposase/recombinase n=1 Tax=Streptomyces sp. NPDC020996 TaxID=3154791 RepID=UPI0033D29FBC
MKYVGDITCLPVDGGKFFHLVALIDLSSRRLAGWAIADRMRTGLVIDALATAERTGGSFAGAVLHTDHGAQGGFSRPSPTPAAGPVSAGPPETVRSVARTSRGFFSVSVTASAPAAALWPASSGTSSASQPSSGPPATKAWTWGLVRE